MNEPFSIFIPSAPKDFNKLKYVINSIRNNIEGYDEIIVCAPDGIDCARSLVNDLLDHDNILMCSDKSVLGIDKSRFKYRPNWVYQMFLKLFQNVTKNDLYFTVDSDLIFNRPVSLFTEDGKRNILMGWEQYNEPYFNFQIKMLNLPRVLPHTCISDTNFMSKTLIKEMLERNGYTKESFIEKAFNVIDETCYPAENEINGQYLYRYHSDKYNFKKIKIHSEGRTVNSINDVAWTDNDIENMMDKMKDKDFDALTLHSWYTDK